MTWPLKLNSKPDPASPLHLELPKEPGITDNPGPDYYIASEPLLAAINTSLILGQPLLVTGEPGCGKTELGKYVAWKLGLYREDDNGEAVINHLIRFDVKSSLGYKDFLYQYDSLSRFHEANMGDKDNPPDAADYIKFVGLGQAILKTMPVAEAMSLLGAQNVHHTEPTRSVVLIDEIDKAPRDVPNDLLREFETMEFNVPELEQDALIKGNKDLRPIAIITSNSERSLPDAFLRRCCFYHMEFPIDDLPKIIEARIMGFPSDGKATGKIIKIFKQLRERKNRLGKPPGTSELLAFVHALKLRDLIDQENVSFKDGWIDVAAATLAKMEDDRTKVIELLKKIEQRPTDT